MTSSELRNVQRAATREARARLELEVAVLAAFKAGQPLRAIGAAAGRSAEWARTVTGRTATPDDVIDRGNAITERLYGAKP